MEPEKAVQTLSDAIVSVLGLRCTHCLESHCRATVCGSDMLTAILRPSSSSAGSAHVKTHARV